MMLECSAVIVLWWLYSFFLFYYVNVHGIAFFFFFDSPLGCGKLEMISYTSAGQWQIRNNTWEIVFEKRQRLFTDKL